MQTMAREIKTITAVMPSGSTTGSGFFMGGYALMGVAIPVLTSALLSVTHAYTGGTLMPIAGNAGTITLATPGGTGGVAINGDVLAYLAPFNGPIHFSAAAAQVADRNFVVYLKG